MKIIPICLICFAVLFGCNNTKKDPGTVLNDARLHTKNKEYAKALKDYVWFFENSTKIEKSMFGVKHSYCVHEWRDLGNLYEPALRVFREELDKRQERLLSGETNWDLFMEFRALCRYDEKINEVVKVFMSYHNGENKDFSENIFRVIKEDLLTQGYIDICSEYLTDPIFEADQIIYLHSMNIKYEKKLQDKGRDRPFAEDMFISEAGYLLTVLKKSNRIDEFEKVKIKLNSHNPSEQLKKLLMELNET